MRTDHPMSAGMLGTRLRAELQRARRTLREQRPIFRWGLGAAALTLLSMLLYLALPGAPGTAVVRSGQTFTPDELLKIEPELQRKNISYRLDHRRIVVAADSLSEANTIVDKLNVGDRPLGDIAKAGSQQNLFEPPDARYQRQLQARNEAIETFIRRMPDSGIIDTYVEIQRRPTRSGFRTDTHPTAFVYLRTERSPIRSQTIKKIEEIIVSYETDIKPDAISVFDDTGHKYSDAFDPKYRERTQTHAREEELSGKILEQIEHIKGVQVTVQMVPVTPAKAEPAAKPEPAPVEVPHFTDVLPPPVVVNQPAEIVAEPEPAPQPKPAPPPAPEVVKPEAPPAASLLARVWVKVPRSWYLRMHPSPQPTPDELRKSKEENERQIRTAVEHVIPPSEASEIKIDTIADELPVRPRQTAAVAPVAKDLRWVWLATGLVAGVAVTLVPLGLHLATTRRPAPRVTRQAEPGWFHVDAGGEAGPGPSERVRELIRLNPEAAASVLHRWTGQGGPVE